MCEGGKKEERCRLCTFENVKEIIGVVGIVTSATQNVQLLSQIIDVIQRRLKKLFDGKLLISILKIGLRTCRSGGERRTWMKRWKLAHFDNCFNC